MHVNQATEMFNKVGRKKYLKNKKKESEFYDKLVSECLEKITRSIEDGETYCELHIAYDCVRNALRNLGYCVSFHGICNTYTASGWAEVDK